MEVLFDFFFPDNGFTYKCYRKAVIWLNFWRRTTLESSSKTTKFKFIVRASLMPRYKLHSLAHTKEQYLILQWKLHKKLQWWSLINPAHATIPSYCLNEPSMFTLKTPSGGADQEICISLRLPSKKVRTGLERSLKFRFTWLRKYPMATDVESNVWEKTHLFLAIHRYYTVTPNHTDQGLNSLPTIKPVKLNFMQTCKPKLKNLLHKSSRTSCLQISTTSSQSLTTCITDSESQRQREQLSSSAKAQRTHSVLVRSLQWANFQMNTLLKQDSLKLDVLLITNFLNISIS